MTPELETWLKQATRHLSKDSSAQVRTEIQEHYESAREAAISSGSAAGEADRLAIAALGDAKTANRQYRKVLLTSAEARMLREGHWEARTVCSRPWLQWLLLVMPVFALFAAPICFLTGAIPTAEMLMVSAIALGPLLVAPFLPVYTERRAQVFRLVKWVALFAALGFAFKTSSTLWISCMWPIAWVEWTRNSIRRKLPVTEWPKHLYL